MPADRKNGVLVTQKRDGRPQMSNITYGVVDDVIKISITAARAKYANLLRNPQASLYVTRDDFWAYVVIEGDAELSEVPTKPDDPGVDELVELLPIGRRRASRLGRLPQGDGRRQASRSCGSSRRTPMACSSDG